MLRGKVQNFNNRQCLSVEERGSILINMGQGINIFEAINKKGSCMQTGKGHVETLLSRRKRKSCTR